MRDRDWDPSADRMYIAYHRIADEHGAGDPDLPLWHGALRHVPWAMTELARRLTDPGRFDDAFSAAGLARRAYRLGNPVAAQNLAMVAFNRGDLAGYRHWLRRGARAGDEELLVELRRFDTRLPHQNAPRGHRRSELRRLP